LLILAQKDSKSSHITYLHLFIVQVEPWARVWIEVLQH
jgi:hypothetical protein